MSQLGRLTLSWVNKERALLGTEAGGYEWVNQHDPRVTEIRLLDPVDIVGQVVSDSTNVADNLLITGDSLHALRSIRSLPEYASKYLHKIKLVYIDPPFNTGQAFAQYDDALEHSVWLTMMRDRLLLIRDLLAPDGSLWVHLDDAEMAYCRVLLDEIFGRSSFISTIVWQKRYSRDNRPAIGPVHDYILVYSPAGDDWKHSRNRIPRTGTKEYRNPNGDSRGPWRAIPLDVQAGHATAAQFYDVITPGGAIHSPPPGRAWSVTKQRMYELISNDRVYFGLNGRGKPNLIRYLDEDKGLVPWTWWPHDEVGHNDESKKELLDLFPDGIPFDTPKPERLLRRVIHIATNPGDIVLDCFAGSGTTAAVAHKMERKWVAVEKEESSVQTYIRPRLEMVVNGNHGGGVTKEVEWEKGGGFRVLSVAPSMYELAGEYIFLSPWLNNGKFAEAVCAQLGFVLDDSPPFVGRKGRTRLAAIDGVADEEVIHSILNHLDETERVVVVAKASTDEAVSLLRALSPGSRLKKVPRDLISPKGRVVR